VKCTLCSCHKTPLSTNFNFLPRTTGARRTQYSRQ